jgi:broad-specificity NMP kinase
LFVTGAPGAGKSSIAEALLRASSEALIFDIDWLTMPVSALVGQSIIEASHLWPRYNRLWLAILEMVVRNGRPAVLFTPWDRNDVATLPAIAGVDPNGWCLLDCDDATRVARLRARGWTAAMIEEAVADAGVLRGQIDFVIDTSRTTPDEAAAHVDGWLATYWPRETRQ